MQNIRRLLLVLFVLINSCTTFRETHYFKDKIKDTNSSNPTTIVPNYYKVSIRGWSFMSSSRYLSGYFDQNSVNEYFNEIPQPDKGALFTNENKVEVKDKADSSKEEEADSKDSSSITNGLKEDGSELVLILSTNSEAIATQIKNTSVNKDVLKSLTLLANKDKLKETNLVNSKINSINTDISLYSLKVVNYIGSLDENNAGNRDKDLLFQFLKSELKELGVTKEFKDFDEIKKWYNENN